MGFELVYPVGPQWIVSQTFAQHEASAKRMGCCPKPGTGCSCYYYGGIDWACVVDTPTVAGADSSEPIEVQNQGTTGYGLNVRIKHKGGFYTIYGHLNSVVVKTGDMVKQGQLIGYSGGAKGSPTSGFSTGPHIHVELRKNGIPVDPAEYLTLSPIPSTDPAPPGPEQTEMPQVPEFPALPKAKVLTNKLNVRTEPWGNTIGTLNSGNVVSVIGALVTTNRELWIHFWHNNLCGWSAMWVPKYDDPLLAEWVD